MFVEMSQMLNWSSLYGTKQEFILGFRAGLLITVCIVVVCCDNWIQTSLLSTVTLTAAQVQRRCCPARRREISSRESASAETKRCYLCPVDSLLFNNAAFLFLAPSLCNKLGYCDIWMPSQGGFLLATGNHTSDYLQAGSMLILHLNLNSLSLTWFSSIRKYI